MTQVIAKVGEGNPILIDIRTYVNSHNCHNGRMNNGYWMFSMQNFCAYVSVPQVMDGYDSKAIHPASSPSQEAYS